MRVFNKQIEEDKKVVVSRSNVCELHKVNSAITLQSHVGIYSVFLVGFSFCQQICQLLVAPIKKVVLVCFRFLKNTTYHAQTYCM